MIKTDNIEVPTRKEEICDANIIEVEAGTTGYKGGDSGHGGRTYFRISNVSGTDMRLSFHAEVGRGTLEQRIAPSGELVHGCDLECDSFELEFGGDAELDTFIRALEFTLETLKSQK